MDTHKNARLTPKGREQMVRAVVESGLSKAAAARQFNTTPKTVAKWVGRFRKEGVDGLRDRSSRPLSSPAKRHKPRAMRSRLCAGSATPASRSPPGRDLARHRQPHPAAARSQQAQCAGAGRAGPAL